MNKETIDKYVERSKQENRRHIYGYTFSTFLKIGNQDGETNYGFNCKEGFISYVGKYKGDFLLLASKEKNLLFADVLKVISKELGVGCKCIILDDGTFLYIQSKFWKSSAIRLDILACIFKSVISAPTRFKNVTSIQDFLSRNPAYFVQDGVKKCLVKAKNILQILGVKRQNEHKFLFNLRCKGLISAVGKTLNKKATDRLFE